tara:strand:- start:493 stop:672 length:180 start_codon:yes stop_codon:yes gene_type:complete
MKKIYKLKNIIKEFGLVFISKIVNMIFSKIGIYNQLEILKLEIRKESDKKLNNKIRYLS